ncbi:MAG: nuclear transport factor 2 family protein [Parasphingorhabdus sp.]
MVVFFAIAPAAASACEIVHGLRINVESGSFRVTLNDVFLYSEDDELSSHERGLTEWLVPNKNTLKIDFDGTKGEFSIVAVCKGEFADDSYLSKVKFTSPSSKELIFTNETAPQYTYLSADIAGSEGLMASVKKLQDAARVGDVDTIMEMHSPMFKEFERRRGNSDGIRNYIRGILTNHPISLAENLTITTIMGGRIHQVFGQDYQSPITVSGKTDNGSFSWTGGAFWARFGDKWKVVAN